MELKESIKEIVSLIRETVYSLFLGNWKFGDIVDQIFLIGVKSQSVVLMTGACTGLVLTAQTFYQFHKFKMDSMTLAVNSVAMCSELGPVLAGLMVSGRVGASMAAELGTMKVSEQIDALRTLNTHPIDYLVIPRMLATTLAMPVLVIETITIGILAGYAIGVYCLGIDEVYSWINMVNITSITHLMTGVIKSVFFGMLIAFIGCYKGLGSKNGARGVGLATTDTVVIASIGILALNFCLTMVLNKLFALL